MAYFTGLIGPIPGPVQGSTPYSLDTFDRGLRTHEIFGEEEPGF